MNAIISIFGMVLSLFGMGTATVSQVNAMRMQPSPPAQVQNYQKCPAPSQPQIQQLPDGSYRVQCVESQP